MSKKRLVFATGNQGKVNEFRQMLGDDYEILSMKDIGVDIDNLYISQPDNGEQALEITETMVRSGAVDIVIVDSVAALVPKAEIEGDMGDSHVGLQARLMSQALRKLTAIASKSNCIIISGIEKAHICCQQD